MPDPKTEVDALIVSGLVHDGTGEPARFVDLALDDGRIVFVGRDAPARFKAASIVDASGLVIAPGFIDPHTHAGSDLVSDERHRRANLPFAFQGVTTVIVGNDGGGSPDIAKLAHAAREHGIGTNVAYLAGFGPIREEMLGSESRAPTLGELERMKARTRQAMCEGAWGFSAGLYYVPQSYAATGEVVALAQVAGELGGYYDTHMRDESTYNVTVTGALAETLEIRRRARIPVHISHIKALGPAVWGHSERMIAMIEEARAHGQRVTADQYPWEASGTRISNALVPRTALEGGLEALRERLDDPAQFEAIRSGMIEGLTRRGGADKLLITGALHGAEVPVGDTLAAFAQARGQEPVDAAIAVLREGDARVASFNMNPEDIAAFAAQKWVVTGSDGSSGHPRKYASFPKAYRDLVAGKAAMPLARFIRRSSGQTADIIGLKDRGYLREGYAADVVVFDPESFGPLATYQSPRKLSAGVMHLLVNGTPVISAGEFTGSLPGLPLLKDSPC
ncbi:amidohydrolase family protein [Erythrobacter sp. THAF29]|uniref:N-acyl-D-amino-acid deacylase family protein n=1 Tax=Erythrobacter sp. THAF29 TaxID=2587851 RepID=UPI001F2E251E|nr:amidohydrolase family protein [Erythrobacter sp. THAF29]